MSLAKFAKKYRVDDPDKFRIDEWDSADTGKLDIEKKEAKDLLAEGVEGYHRLAAAIASMRERIPDLVIADVCLPSIKMFIGNSHG